MTIKQLLVATVALALGGAGTVVMGETGDPQIRTDHDWYPGELAVSTFPRLFATQDALYERVTGREVKTDEDRALASWFWRNTHYWHGEAGRRDLWGTGLQGQGDHRLREYWSGLFAYGFGLCGTTHSQWTAELNERLGHARGRGVGAAGHNAFEVFLTGDAYGDGRWALLDHDLSTVIFDPSGRRLLGLGEIQGDVTRLIDREFKPERQRGWLVCGLHPADGDSYRKYAVAEYLAGYAGPPPVVHLRRGETMRRDFAPGLGDGKTFVFWGRNYRTAGIPGPERSRTWVNQPEAMNGSVSGTPHVDGQVRYANVEYVYEPDFTSADFREGVVGESDSQVTFEFSTPYIIAASPPDESDWGIYESGCRNGLVVSGVDCEVQVSTDYGQNWSSGEMVGDGTDLTDAVKGRSQYWLRFGAGADSLAQSSVKIRTVCQANVAVLPRLRDGGTTVTYQSGNQRVRSFGPELAAVKPFVVDGGLGERSVSLRLESPRDLVGVHAAAHVASGSPPNAETQYRIEFSVDQKKWEPIVGDWTVLRRGDEPADFWSQSFCYGNTPLQHDRGKPIWIRFRNDGGKRYLRVEAHLVESVPRPDPVRVRYRWTDSSGTHEASHRFSSGGPSAAGGSSAIARQWQVETKADVRTHWVEFVVDHNENDSR